MTSTCPSFFLVVLLKIAGKLSIILLNIFKENFLLLPHNFVSTIYHPNKIIYIIPIQITNAKFLAKFCCVHENLKKLFLFSYKNKTLYGEFCVVSPKIIDPKLSSEFSICCGLQKFKK